MKILLTLSALASFYFLWRTIVLTKTVEKLAKELLVAKITIPPEEKIAQDSFFKFVSDSREWAFEYIEEVQRQVKKFIDTIDNDIDYFDKYGEVIWTPLTPVMQKISIAFKELKTVMPDESKNN